MPFTEEQLETIQAYFDREWKTPRKCPVCGREPRHWTLVDHFGMIPLRTGDRINLDSSNDVVEGIAVAPVVIVRCRECSNLLFFGASSMGLIEATAGPDTELTIPTR